MMENLEIWDEVLHDFGVKMPRVMIGGRFAVVDSVRKIYVLSDDIVTLQTSEGYVSIFGEDISVKTLCDERIELTGEFSGVEFIRPGRTHRRTENRKNEDAEDNKTERREEKGSEDSLRNGK